MRSTNTVKASPKASRVSGVGQMKSAIATAALDHAVARPAHAARLLNPVLPGEAEVAVDVLTHLVVVEQTALSIGASARVSGLARARQPYDEDLAVHSGNSQAVLGTLVVDTGSDAVRAAVREICSGPIRRSMGFDLPQLEQREHG
jgi:hypothetical protein